MKKILNHLAVFCACAALLAALLVGAACIPRGAIADNMRESAEYLAARPTFPFMRRDVYASRVDRYADAILLNIAWNYDGAHPLRSVALSSYFHTSGQGENANLLESVTRGGEARRDYLRYWHGSITLVRPLLTVLNLRQIYVLNAVLLAALTLWLLVSLWLRGERAAAVGVLAGLLAAAFWYVPLSLEYTWVFLLAPVLSLVVLRLAKNGRWERAGTLFLVGGMATSYLDFLTAETLTLTLPLLLLVWLRRRDAKAAPVETATGAVRAWVFGYVGMWVAKWLFARLVLGHSVMHYVTAHVEERLGGEVAGVSARSMTLGALRRNVAALFPAGWGLAGTLAALALLLGAVCFAYFRRRPRRNKKLLLTCAALGLLPYLRFLILRNHSYVHFFFTFRAQAATVLALVLILAELTEKRKGDEGKKKKPRVSSSPL